MALIQLIYERPHYETVVLVVEVPDDQEGVDLKSLISETELKSCSAFESDDLRPGEFSFEVESEISEDEASPQYRLINGVLQKVS